MDKFKFNSPELDPEKIALWGPPTTGNEGDELGWSGNKVTAEKTEKIMKLFEIITYYPALKHWGLK